MLKRLKRRNAKVGVFAVGHGTYWNQFEGLLDNLMGYHAEFKRLVVGNEVEVIDYGIVDSNTLGF